MPKRRDVNLNDDEIKIKNIIGKKEIRALKKKFKDSIKENSALPKNDLDLDMINKDLSWLKIYFFQLQFVCHLQVFLIQLW